MIYYSVAYMKDGQIHLKPHSTKEGAQKTIDLLKESKWKDQIDTTKIVKKDPESPWYKSVKGYWI